jgi:hypothetical protein
MQLWGAPATSCEISALAMNMNMQHTHIEKSNIHVEKPMVHPANVYSTQQIYVEIKLQSQCMRSTFGGYAECT